jgi:hypothetical protein
MIYKKFKIGIENSTCQIVFITILKSPICYKNINNLECLEKFNKFVNERETDKFKVYEFKFERSDYNNDLVHLNVSGISAYRGRCLFTKKINHFTYSFHH